MGRRNRAVSERLLVWRGDAVFLGPLTGKKNVGPKIFKILVLFKKNKKQIRCL